MLSLPMTSHRYQLTRMIHVSDFIKLFTYANVYPGNTSTTTSGIRYRLLIRILKMRWRRWRWRTSLSCGISSLVRFYFYFLPRRKGRSTLLILCLSTAHVLQFTIGSFLGRKFPQINVHKKAHSHNKATPTPEPFELLCKQATLAKYGGRKFKEIRAVQKAAYKERTANKVNGCRGCGRKATERETFKRCGACWKIDREVLYCSEYVVNF